MIQVTEGINGYYHYHLSEEGKYTSLCGVQTMRCSLKIDAWGVKTHLNERYCEKCWDLNQEPISIIDDTMHRIETFRIERRSDSHIWIAVDLPGNIRTVYEITSDTAIKVSRLDED